VRILHLVAPGSRGGGPCTLRAAADVIDRWPDNRHDVVLFGHGTDERTARRCGLRPTGRLAAPAADPARAWRPLRRVLECLERASSRYDLIHAWTADCGVAARHAAARRSLLVWTADRSAVGAAAWLTRRQVPVLAEAVAAREAILAAGGDRAFVTAMPGGVDPRHLDRDARSSLRGGWGVDATSFVVGLLAEPAAGGDGETAIHAVGRPYLSGLDVRLVMHHAAAPPSGIRRWRRKLGLDDAIITDDRLAEPWRVAAGLDAALFVASPLGTAARRAALAGPRRRALTPRSAGPGPASPAPLAWAMACGLPVIAEDHAETRELVADRGILVERGDYHAMGTHVMDLFADPDAARRLARASRSASRRFTTDTMATRIMQAWRCVLRGAPVKVDGGAVIVEVRKASSEALEI